VERLSTGAGGVSSETNARMTMSLYALATERGMRSVDHLALNHQGTEHPAGSLVVLVQGQDPSNPANWSAHMSTTEAANRPVEQSLQQVQSIEQQQTQLANRVQAQDPMILAAREVPTRAM
jgi:protein subunit release factor B